MDDSIELTIGAEARCTDGVCGEVSQIVFDPVPSSVTHLIVEPPHRQGLGRLVPVALVEPGAGGINLRCSLEEFDALERAEETRLLPGTEGAPGAVDYFGGNTSEPVVDDLLPQGEVAFRKGDAVQASDGHIGHVQGVVVDSANYRATHVLLEEGHLWGRKEVAIPIGMVTAFEEGIKLNISKEEVQNLPAVDC